MPILAPREAFMAGHNISYTGSYFDQVLLADRLSISTEDKIKKHVEKMIGVLKHTGEAFALRLKHVRLIAQEAGIVDRKLPAMPMEYRQWVPEVHRDFVSLWSVSNVEGWLFAMGFSIGELRNALIVLLLCFDFHVHLSVDMLRDITRIRQQLLGSLKRWRMSADRLESMKWGDVFSQRFAKLSPILSTLLAQIVEKESNLAEMIPLIQFLLTELAEIEKTDVAGLPTSSN